MKLGSLVTLILLSLVAVLVPGHTADAAIPVPADVDPRPNIVFVLMDDFSLELLATMPEAQRMQGRGRDVPQRLRRRLAVLPVPRGAAHRPDAAPDRRADQHRPTTRATRSAATSAFVQHGNEPRQFNVALQDSGYTHRLHRQVHERLRGERPSTASAQPPAAVPGWTDWQAILGGGYNGWGYKSTYLDEDGQVQAAQPPEAGTRRRRSRSSTAPTPPTCAPTRPSTSSRSSSPATRRTSSRSRPTARTASCQKAYPGQPAVPLGVRRPGAGGRPDRRQLRHRGLR